VGRGGAAHGVDITPAMLDIARARQELLGIQNVSFTEADAQTATLPCGADAAMSRFGTMFFDEPITAFENVRRSLQPRGRLGIVTWQPLEQNAWLVVPGAALLPWIALPDLNGKGPGMFSQSDAVTIVQTLAQAGFTDIDSRPLKLALPLGRNVDQAYALLADTGVGRGALSAVPEPQRDAAADAVRSALEPHAHADGVWLGAAILLTTARTSS